MGQLPDEGIKQIFTLKVSKAVLLRPSELCFSMFLEDILSEPNLDCFWVVLSAWTSIIFGLQWIRINSLDVNDRFLAFELPRFELNLNKRAIHLEWKCWSNSKLTFARSNFEFSPSLVKLLFRWGLKKKYFGIWSDICISWISSQRKKGSLTCLFGMKSSGFLCQFRNYFIAPPTTKNVLAAN